MYRSKNIKQSNSTHIFHCQANPFFTFTGFEMNIIWIEKIKNYPEKFHWDKNKLTIFFCGSFVFTIFQALRVYYKLAEIQTSHLKIEDIEEVCIVFRYCYLLIKSLIVKLPIITTKPTVEWFYCQTSCTVIRFLDDLEWNTILASIRIQFSIL